MGSTLISRSRFTSKIALTTRAFLLGKTLLSGSCINDVDRVTLNNMGSRRKRRITLEIVHWTETSVAHFPMKPNQVSNFVQRAQAF